MLGVSTSISVGSPQIRHGGVLNLQTGQFVQERPRTLSFLMSQPDLQDGQLEIFDSSKPICSPLSDFCISRAKVDGALIEEITCVAFLALEIPT